MVYKPADPDEAAANTIKILEELLDKRSLKEGGIIDKLRENGMVVGDRLVLEDIYEYKLEEDKYRRLNEIRAIVDDIFNDWENKAKIIMLNLPSDTDIRKRYLNKIESMSSDLIIKHELNYKLGDGQDYMVQSIKKAVNSLKNLLKNYDSGLDAPQTMV
jgi:hypothetical protein